MQPLQLKQWRDESKTSREIGALVLLIREERLVKGFE
jgi:hypothetical protein